MGTIWLKDIKAGLDTRRMPELLPGGSAIRANDGHVNRGGEFEQRAAFVENYSLPAGQTVGLAYGKSGLYVFGHAAAPVMPRGVTYQRLQHPDGSTPIFRILSAELFAAKIYVVAEFQDGTQYHYYNGTRVTDWQDGRARAAVVVTGGIQAATSATGGFTVSGGSNGILNTFADIKLNGVSIIGAPVQHTGNDSTTATAIAAAITAFASVPDYSAVAVGAVITITATATGIAANGFTPVLTMTGDVAAASITAMSGGAVSAPSQLADLFVNGVPIIAAPVDWVTDNATTAEAIAAAINNYESVPDYTATVVGNKVNILASDPGVAPNGFAVTFTLVRNLVFTPGVGVVLANGLAPGVVFQSGTSAKTVGSKVYVTAGTNLSFSAVRLPTQFQTTPGPGAGFIDMSAEAAGAESLQAIAKYQQYIAIFAGRVTLIWYVDPDPTLNKSAQTLNNVGTLSPRSVTQFGDNDLFFLDESGVRSLRARVNTTAASTTDIGIPVDTLIVAKLATLSALQRSQLVGLIEPSSGRFWLVFPDQIFVFSLFEGSKISAWSTYTPAVANVPFTVNDAVVFRKKVFLRSGDKIYIYGGTGTAPTFDGTEPELWLPYLDANAPAVTKQFKTIDVACEGTWLINAGFDPTNLLATDKVAQVSKTTYGADKIPFENEATHVSLRFKGVGSGFKKVGAAAINFEGDDK